MEYSSKIHQRSSRVVFGPKADGQHVLSLYIFFYFFD